MGFKDPLVRVCDFTQTQPKKNHILLKKKIHMHHRFLTKSQPNHVNPSLPCISPDNQIYTAAASGNSECGKTMAACAAA